MQKLIRLAKLFRSSRLRRETGKQKNYPRVIQLPITYKCNSRCVMCDVWNMDYSNEADVDEFASFLQDPIFSEVRAVGINGGEPTLVANLPAYARRILSLPKLKSLNIISHGFHTPRLVRMLEEINKDCREAGVAFHVSISVDGIGEIHNTVRGVPEVFDKTLQSINEIHKNKDKYCSSFDIGCTVVEQNVDHLVELDEFATTHGWKVKYRLGIANERIKSTTLMDQFSVLHSPVRQSAIEFFHSRISHSAADEWFKYFSIYYWLTSIKPKRLMGCIWKENGVTLDSRGELYYCAVASKSLGSLRDATGEGIFLSEENRAYRSELLEKHCDNCIHDYHGQPLLRDSLFAVWQDLWRRNAMHCFRLLNLIQPYRK